MTVTAISQRAVTLPFHLHIMKRNLIISLVIAAVLGSVTAHAANLIVDDNLQCPGAQFSTIQSAVNAANPNDTIRVCPGTYAEQVRIDKDLKVEGISFGNDNLVLLLPGALAANSSSLVSGAPFAAILLVDGARKVDLSNLTVDGANNGLNSCGINFAGIYYRNSSGSISSVVTRNTQLAAGGEGLPDGPWNFCAEFGQWFGQSGSVEQQCARLPEGRHRG